MEFPDDYSFPDKISEINSYKLNIGKMKKLEKDWPSDFSPWFFQRPRERQVFDYDDIQLIPKKGILDSRGRADTSVEFGGYRWELPVLPANMSSIVDRDICYKLGSHGYLYCMHRFLSYEERFIFINDISALNKVPVSMAFGVKEEEFKFAQEVRNDGYFVDLLWIDVAHGYSDVVEEAIKRYRSIFPEAFIIAGNVAEVEGALFLEKAGADAVKLGVGHGEVCTTRLQTGFSNYNWQLSALRDTANELEIPIVCDGGIRNYGDIAKALVMGATVCMAGSLFAALQDSPGKLIFENNCLYKEYYGSASEREKGAHVFEEGKTMLKPLRHHYFPEELSRIKQGLQSAISYAGGKDLSAFNSVEYIITK